MTISPALTPRATIAARPQHSASPAPPAGGDQVDLGSSVGRTVSAWGGGIAAGAGLGILGAQAGGRLGFVLGLTCTPANQGLGQAFLRALQGAAWGQVIGGAACCAAGATLGAVVAKELYDYAHS